MQQLEPAPLPIRVTFGTIAIVGFALYAMIFFAGVIGTRDALHAQGDHSLAGWTLAILHTVIFAGLSPLAISTYFWLIRRDRAAYLPGLYLLIVAIAIHYGVAVVMAHTDEGIAMAVGGAELLACGAVIAVAHRANRARTKVVDVA